MKNTSSKTLVIKIILFFLAVFVVLYVTTILQPDDSFYGQSIAIASLRRRCSFPDCHHKKVEEEPMKAVLEENTVEEIKIPQFFIDLLNNSRVALVNMKSREVSKQWSYVSEVNFHRVSKTFEWKDLFPEWIDEEEENEGPSCPEIPMPDFSVTAEMDVVVARIPCRWPEKGWKRDVFRLQVHLIAANLAVRRAARYGDGKVMLVILSPCRPMMEIFRCDDIVRREGHWWFYEIEVRRLEEKVALPVGSCNLALPLWAEGINEEYHRPWFPATPAGSIRRQAYATVMHTSEKYVCGAIALAQSIKKSGSKRDLLLLHDDKITPGNLAALRSAGWTLRLIERIRNPRAQKGTYNEYNYSKFRLWLLTDYHKVIFIDSDIIVLKNLDILFNLPQLSAAGNDGVIFNSGVMVIEPSKCTFKYLMKKRNTILSYNGGDQGFLNEIIVWWHRLPRRVNYLKNFWANTTTESSLKNHLFGADPPEVYTIHYLGLKPWYCYRDYDCNWNIGNQRVYASDIAHWRWWRLHDEMDAGLQKFCGLTDRRKIELAWDRMKAETFGFADKHWNWNVTDKRIYE